MVVKNFFFYSFVRRLDDPAIRVYLTCHNILHSTTKPEKRCNLGKSHCCQVLVVSPKIFSSEPAPKRTDLQFREFIYVLYVFYSKIICCSIFFPLVEYCVWYLLTRCKSFRKKAYTYLCINIYQYTPSIFYSSPSHNSIKPIPRL